MTSQPPLTPMSLAHAPGPHRSRMVAPARRSSISPTPGSGGPTTRSISPSSSSADPARRRSARPPVPTARWRRTSCSPWLGGGRLFELKTVQILDDLEIGRPCIDMETIGYNIEWSQELDVPQSLAEYVKAWMAARRAPAAGSRSREFIGDPGPHVFDMSVGYDLAGIPTDKVASFIRGMRDATRVDRRAAAGADRARSPSSPTSTSTRSSPTRSRCRPSTAARPRRSSRSPST